MTFNYRQTFEIAGLFAVVGVGCFILGQSGRATKPMYKRATHPAAPVYCEYVLVPPERSKRPSACFRELASLPVAPGGASDSRGGGVANSSDSLYPSAVYEVTAYCPCSICCGSWSDGITASGHVIKPGDKFCAADKSIPFGTMLDIPGYGVVPVLDRGGAIKGNRIDVYFDTHEAALQWGRKQLTVKG